MDVRKTNIDMVRPFDHQPTAQVSAAIADVGRKIGSVKTGFVVQTVPPGFQSSQRHRHLFQEEILIVMSGNGQLLHGDEAVPVSEGDCVCYRAGDPEPHAFLNTGKNDLVIWAFGDRHSHEVCIYPDKNTAFVEGLEADVPLDSISESIWTEERRPK